MSNKPRKNPSLSTFAQKPNYVLQATQALQQETFTLAVDAAQAALNEHPENPEAYQLLATAYERSGQVDKAIELLANRPQATLTAASALYCAELYLSKHQLDNAIKMLLKSLELQPRNNPAREKLILVYRASGKFLLAYIEFLQLQKDRELTLKEKSDLIDCINNTNFLNYHLELLEKINQLLEDEQLDRRRLSTKVGELLLQACPDLADNYVPSLEHPLLTHSAFLGLMKKFPMSHPDIDFFLTSTRRKVMMNIAEKGEIADEYLPLCLAIATQNFLNEYIHSVTEDEQAIIDSLHQLITLQAAEPHWIPADSEAIFVILLMYEPLNSIAKLIALPLSIEHWPNNLQTFAQQQLLEPEEEIQLASQIPALTAMSKLTPTAVRQLYEENPYPRWLECSTQPIDSLGNYFRSLYPHFALSKEFFNTQPRILVAGCGTGKHAIEVAYQFPKAQITAFDISLRSLGYAQRMANKLQVPNVKFFHGDILEVTPDLGSFDIIECCGVLHHLVDPIAGWKKLKALLAPKGIMHIALYSRAARRDIINRRHQIKELGIRDTPTDMKKFRSAILTQKSDHLLLKFRDFYVTSEFRDLLFHPQETQYSLDEIQDILQDLSLKFVALQIEPTLRNYFHMEMPQADELDWKNWKILEEKNPIVFSGMYSFWCQTN